MIRVEYTRSHRLSVLYFSTSGAEQKTGFDRLEYHSN